MGVRVSEIDYYSLHGIWGAYASFVLGRIGQGAGVVIGNVQPPSRGIFVGYRVGHEIPCLLPFCTGHGVGIGVSAYIDQDAPVKPVIGPAEYSYFSENDIERSVSFSGETWKAGLLTMKVTSFFGEIPNPQGTDPAVLRSRMRPALYISLSFDNSEGTEPLVGLFGMQGIRRPLSDVSHGSLLGFAQGTSWGFATQPAEMVDEVMDWRVVDAAFDAERPLRRLASEGALRFRVNGGEKKEFIIALGVYRDGVITAGQKTVAYYTSLFRDLEEVLGTALDEASDALKRSNLLDAELDEAPLSDDRKFLLAHATHSYSANTELLLTERGEPLFVVNEGEYQMMNTLDLTVDQSFFELCYSPWTVRNELDALFARSTYTDAFGLAFTHDQGVSDCFTPQGSSSYEMPYISECFSFMSYEETVNWVLSACLYMHQTNDAVWFENHKAHLIACLESLENRDRNGDGIMDIDSDRCAGGGEITTYDSLDVSLGQARNNLYLAVKAWAAFVCLDALFTRYDHSSSGSASRAREIAHRASTSICSMMLEKEGYIPAVFESDNRSKIIPAVEGLIYPYLCGAAQAVSPDGPYGTLIHALKRHLDTVLVPGSCIDAVSGGWKLSSTSRNTWLSKIFLNQYVTEKILKIKDERTQRDHVHARWLRTGSAQWAATDQVDASDGHDLGSRLYPRLVTSILWLKDSRLQQKGIGKKS